MDSQNEKTNNECDHLPIEESIRLSKQLLDNVLKDNDTVKGLAEVEPYCDRSIYHSFLKMICMIITAIVTMDKLDIESANQSVEETKKLCNKYRKTGFIISFMKLLKTPDYDKYTDLELHSELIHTICYVSSAAVLAIETNNIYSLIRLAYRLQKCIKNFRYCKISAKTRTHWENELSENTYKSAVLLGNGLRNLAISNIPPKVLAIINFLGIKGSESNGWKSINEGTLVEPGIFSIPCVWFRIAYWLYAEPHGYMGPKNNDFCRQVLNSQLEIYPKNLILRTAEAKLEEISGNIDKAIEIYNELLSDPHMAPKRIFHFHLMFCYALKCDWDPCIDNASKFRTGSLYSPAMATYFEAIVRYAKAVDLDDKEEMEKAVKLFKVTPSLRIRHLGKTITPEKIAVVRSENFFKNNNLLVLPDIEVLCETNYIIFIKNDKNLLQKFMSRIDKQINKHKEDLNLSDNLDNYLKAMYLKGVIYKLLDEYDHAKQCFEFVVNNESRIGREFSLPPQSMLELGLIEVILNNKDKAIELINKCINDYSGYTNDVYVHIRAFAGLRSLGVTTDKQNENDNKLEDYKKQWLRNLSLKEKKYNKVIEEEDTVDNKHNVIHK